VRDTYLKPFGKMKIVNVEEAISLIPPDAVIGLGNACGEPQTIIDGLIETHKRFRDAKLVGMIQLSSPADLAGGSRITILGRHL
jgi:acyl-CoA hydrolase